MVTVIRPSRARCVKGRIPRHERAVFTFKEGWLLTYEARGESEISSAAAGGGKQKSRRA
jgi:hypothetical protein